MDVNVLKSLHQMLTLKKITYLLTGTTGLAYFGIKIQEPNDIDILIIPKDDFDMQRIINFIYTEKKGRYIPIEEKYSSLNVSTTIYEFMFEGIKINAFIGSYMNIDESIHSYTGAFREKGRYIEVNAFANMQPLKICSVRDMIIAKLKLKRKKDVSFAKSLICNIIDFIDY